MKKSKIVEVNGKFRIERKNKKTGGRDYLWNKDKVIFEFDTREEAQKKLTPGWEVKPATSGAGLTI